MTSDHRPHGMREVRAHPVRRNASDIGTGARTALTLIAADALGAAPDRVHVRLGDSDLVMAGIAGGSTGTRSWSWAVTLAAAELRERLALGADIPPEGITVRSDTTAALGALAQKERHSSAPSSPRSPWTRPRVRCGYAACSVSSPPAGSSTRSPRVASASAV